ncbi:hypothetical protein ACH5RR_027025 [Cinchona calisaya]|uniref:Hydroxyproline-rich glycoprotein family protein n=1 Tax=Cinchona calisaya TaxID=153742 RepID=A0ABD2Z992_9GENT
MANEGSSRPAISFPSGLALLIILLICISGFFYCCYNWNKLRSLLQLSSMPQDVEENHSDSTPTHSNIIKQPEQKHAESLTVVMPGDETPKFLAFPAPHEESQVVNFEELLQK